MDIHKIILKMFYSIQDIVENIKTSNAELYATLRLRCKLMLLLHKTAFGFL